MTRGADREETGTVMGVAQTFGGVSRVAAPLMATAAFESTSGSRSSSAQRSSPS